ncbi:MAG: methionyl-tRNA formyltransferase [Bacteroidetes bacterium]|nr:methionyl-tRNA formyltransferase [Bacteroidota bacterium]
MKNHPRIVFYGTPAIAVASLQSLVHAGYNISAVVTAPDRMAGRGLKVQFSPVKEFALRNDLPILQPANLKDPDFHEQLREMDPEIQVVVAFRMLPKEVWSLPRLGTFNLHASLLPQYRGAAPINWAIINGEKETGVTTFFIDEKIDTGSIIFRETLSIGPEETAGELHDKIMTAGAILVLKTVKAVESGTVSPVAQDEVADSDPGALKRAPKIQKEDCRIRWDQEAVAVYNFVRGMNPHPGAFSELTKSDGSALYLKVFRVQPELSSHSLHPGTVVCDGKTYIKIAVLNGFIHLCDVQPAGRKAMHSLDFLKGYGMHFV